MKPLRSLLLIFGVLLLGKSAALAQPTPPSFDPDPAFQAARELAFNGEHQASRDTLNKILDAYPEYTEVHAFLANTYRWEGNHEEARRHFNRITSRERGQEGIWEAAIRNEVQAGNPSIALGLANKALSYLGSSPAIEAIRRDLMDGGQQARPVQDAAEGSDPEFRNTLAVSNAVEAFDAYYDPMFYGTLEYQRQTRLGKLLPRINFSNRFGQNGAQVELDLYPRISKRFYAYASYGFSDSPIFPRHRAGAELYANLPGDLEASLGMRYLDFRETRAVLPTASLGLYRGDYYLSFRPYLTFVNGRKPGVSGNLIARNYLKDRTHFLGINLAYGFSPELRQLGSGTVVLAETLLFLESGQAFLEYQFGSGGGRHLYRARLGASRQEYVLEPGSFFWAFSAGLTYSLGL